MIENYRLDKLDTQSKQFRIITGISVVINNKRRVGMVAIHGHPG